MYIIECEFLHNIKIVKNKNFSLKKNYSMIWNESALNKNCTNSNKLKDLMIETIPFSWISNLSIRQDSACVVSGLFEKKNLKLTSLNYLLKK